jgi:hypothetical protein
MANRNEWLHFHPFGEGAQLLLGKGFAFHKGDGVADRYVSPDGLTTAWVFPRFKGLPDGRCTQIDEITYSRAA